jgi:hypothetical protein
MHNFKVNQNLTIIEKENILLWIIKKLKNAAIQINYKKGLTFLVSLLFAYPQKN